MTQKVAIDRDLFDHRYRDAVGRVAHEQILLTGLDYSPPEVDRRTNGEGLMDALIPVERWRRARAEYQGAEITLHGGTERKTVRGKKLDDLIRGGSIVRQRLGDALEARWHELVAASVAEDRKKQRELMVGLGESESERMESLRQGLTEAYSAQRQSETPDGTQLEALKAWGQDRLDEHANQQTKWLLDGEDPGNNAQGSAKQSIAAAARAARKSTRLARTSQAVHEAINTGKSAITAVAITGGPVLARSNGAALGIDSVTGRRYITVAPTARAVRFRASNPSDGAGIIEDESPAQPTWAITVVGTESEQTRIRAGWSSDTPPTHGAHELTIGLRNDTAPSETKLDVRVDDHAPSFARAALADKTPRVGRVVSIQFDTATGGNGTLTYSVAPGLSWLSFDARTRTLTGTPTEQMETTEITCTATDADGDEAEQSVMVTVRPRQGG